MMGGMSCLILNELHAYIVKQAHGGAYDSVARAYSDVVFVIPIVIYTMVLTIMNILDWCIYCAPRQFLSNDDDEEEPDRMSFAFASVLGSFVSIASSVFLHIIYIMASDRKTNAFFHSMPHAAPVLLIPLNFVAFILLILIYMARPYTEKGKPIDQIKVPLLSGPEDEEIV